MKVKLREAKDLGASGKLEAYFTRAQTEGC